ncbi:MAG: hypothetical protein IPH09_00785 [bacterium]|nr:hypothetical protein [bacterium]
MNRHLLKICCLAVSILLWIQVASDRQVTREVEVPLRVTGLARGCTLAGNLVPEAVRIRAGGTKLNFFLNRYFGRELGEALVDLGGAEPGGVVEREVTVDGRRGELVDIQVTSPARLEFYVDRIDSVAVPVEVPVAEDAPADRVLAAAPTASPATVQLVGPSRFLPGAGRPRTDPVAIGRGTGSLEIMRAVHAPRPQLWTAPREVRVSAVVAEAGRRVFARVPLVPRLDSGSLRVEVFPPVADVEVRGPAPALAAMPDDAVALTVAAGSFGPGAHTVRPDVRLPAACTLVSLTPPEVMIVVGGRARQP